MVFAILGKLFNLPGRISEYIHTLLLLDILPLRPGHTLVIPKIHVSRVSELPKEYAAAIGDAVTKVANALTGGMSGAYYREISALRLPWNPSIAEHSAEYRLQPGVCSSSASCWFGLILYCLPGDEYDLQVHYHVIPAPRFGENSLQSSEDVIPTGTFTQKKVHRAEYEARHELDDDDAAQLVEKIKARL